MKLRLGYSTVDVRADSKRCNAKNACGLWRDIVGSCDGEIDLDTQLTGAKFVHTVLHELIHQAAHFNNMNLSEAKTDLLSGALTEMLFTSGLININDFERRLKRRLGVKCLRSRKGSK